MRVRTASRGGAVFLGTLSRLPRLRREDDGLWQFEMLFDEKGAAAV